MNISIIMPSYNRAKYIGITIESFLKQIYTKGKYEIIIVDNNSTDNTKEIVQKYINNKQNIEVTYLFEKRQGVHYARNTAAKQAKYELLYFTDDDMIADIHLLEEIVKPFEFNPNVGTATGRVLPKWEIKPPKWILKHCNNYLLSLLDPPEEFLITKEIKYLYSCHQAVRKDVLFEAEGFNPENTKGVWIGDGETGLNIKIKQKGYLYGYNGKSIIHHIIPRSRMDQKYLNKRIGNSGYCHMYTWYRESQPNNKNIILKIIEIIFFRWPAHTCYIFAQMIYKKDFNYIRFILAYMFYYKNQVKYILRLALNSRFKKVIQKRDWLTNDNEFYDEITEMAKVL